MATSARSSTDSGSSSSHRGGDADAQAQLDRAIAELDGSRHVAADPGGQAHGVGHVVDPGQHDGEAVAAEAGQRRRRSPHGVGHPLGHPAACSSSPAARPATALSGLKRSTSHTIATTDPGGTLGPAHRRAAASASAASRRSMRRTRLGRPVSGSVKARLARARADSTRSVTSRALSTRPPDGRVVPQVRDDHLEVAPRAVLGLQAQLDRGADALVVGPGQADDVGGIVVGVDQGQQVVPLELRLGVAEDAGGRPG